MFDNLSLLILGCTGVTLGAAYILYRRLKGDIKKMANDFTALRQAEADHAAAVQAVVKEIDDLVAKLAQTPPSDQPTIDAITADIQSQTAALAAAATKGS